MWVRPPNYKCDTKYHEGVVEEILSDQVVSIDGWPRHIRDIRPRTRPQLPSAETPGKDPHCGPTEEPQYWTLNAARASQRSDETHDLENVLDENPPEEPIDLEPQDSQEARPPTPRPQRERHPPDWYGNRVDPEDQEGVWV